MYVEYSGWKKGFGQFCSEIYLDENKTDYEILYKSGMLAKQTSSFREVTHDWNNDGDIYTQFGAWFDYFDKDGRRIGAEFLTPETMIRGLIDGKEQPEYRKDDCIIDISGVEIPKLKRRETLDEQILKSERRYEMAEIERYRKMAALGIRHPNEPWAR